MKSPLPPKQYSKAVLGNAATEAQLEELHELHAAAHPIVTHTRSEFRPIGESTVVRRRQTRVEILSGNPKAVPTSVHRIAEGHAICNEDLDQWNKRLGVTIAFGRALKKLRQVVAA